MKSFTLIIKGVKMKMIKKAWWLTLITGIIFIGIGLTSIFNSSLILSGIIIIVGVAFLFAGINSIVTFFMISQKGEGAYGHLLYAIINVIFGMLLVISPAMSAVVIVYYLAGWALFRGIMQIIFGMKLPIFKKGTIGSGIFILIFSVIMFVYPEAISDIIISIFGFFTLIFGIIQVFSALKLKEMSKQTLIV